MKWKDRLLRLLFPPRCLLCGRVLPAGQDICGDCEKDLPKEPCFRRYSLPGAGAEGFQIFSALSYRDGFRQTLYRFKFRGRRALAEPIGRLMAKTARECGVALDAVAWVPMTGAKKRKRGYDQSELLARETAGELGLPCLPLLEKVRETGVQHELSRKERQRNVKRAYRALEGAAGKSVLLVDDIVTTGATLTECAEVLLAAGADRVTGLTAASAEMTLRKEGSV